MPSIYRALIIMILNITLVPIAPMAINLGTHLRIWLTNLKICCLLLNLTQWVAYLCWSIERVGGWANHKLRNELFA
jgi:hypothetical protein